jgi:hypothetical protein
MKRSAGFVLAGILASLPLTSMTYYVLELRGGSHIYATDAPVRKGRVTLFHRYPDGVYMSVSASEVIGVQAATEPPRQTERLAPGQTLYIGGVMEGPSHAAAPVGPAPEPSGYADSSSGGYLDSGYGYWGGYAPPPRPVPPPPRTNIGPNGFPILAPPGTAGSTPPAIGPNGFPILAPAPPVASPRQP